MSLTDCQTVFSGGEDCPEYQLIYMSCLPWIDMTSSSSEHFLNPDERKVHHCAVPRLGGIAFKPVVFFTIALLLGINMVLGHSEILSEIGNDDTRTENTKQKCQ